MSTEPRTTHVNVHVTKSLEIEEPDWCVGHREDRAHYKVDVTHYGPEHTIAPNGIDLFRAQLAQSPFAQTTTTDVVLYVVQTEFARDLTPGQADELADALIEAAARLRELGRDLAALLAGGGR